MTSINQAITLHEGLDGVYVLNTELSKVDGLAGKLTIRGYSLEEFAGKASYEEVIFLLLEGKFPNKDELDKLKKEMKNHRNLKPIIIELLKQAAESNVHSMDAVRMGVSALSLETGYIIGSQGDEKNKELGIRIISAVPTILSTFWRFKAGKDYVKPNLELDHVANFLYMLTGEIPNEKKVRALETYMNSVSDHGLNASTFVARAIVSTNSDMISGITGAIGSLKGPAHGGAPGPVLEMIHEIGKIENTEAYIRNKLENNERIMGFGHRVYKVRDPRAEVLSRASESLYEGDEHEFYDLVMNMEKIILKLLEEYKPGRVIKTNVEFFTALVLNGVGLQSDIFSSIFMMARVTGWVANIVEQYDHNRLIRPRANYIGEFNKKWVNINERN